MKNLTTWMVLTLTIATIVAIVAGCQENKGPKTFPPGMVRWEIERDCSSEVKETYIGENNPEKARQDIIAYAQNPIKQTDKWETERQERVETPEFSNCKAKKSEEWVKKHPQEATYEDGTK